MAFLVGRDVPGPPQSLPPVGPEARPYLDFPQGTSPGLYHTRGDPGSLPDALRPQSWRGAQIRHSRWTDSAHVPERLSVMG